MIGGSRLSEHVFGYGSLAEPVPGARVAELRDAVRVWGVAMDNARDLPGYKFYVRPGGERPRVCVAFLDVADRPGGAVNGVCRPVDAAALVALDARERNYRRVEVSDRVAGAGGRVWAYVGREDSRERLRRARRQGRAVVSRGYLELVLEGFGALGEPALERFHATTEPAGLPVLALERVELP